MTSVAYCLRPANGKASALRFDQKWLARRRWGIYSVVKYKQYLLSCLCLHTIYGQCKFLLLGMARHTIVNTANENSAITVAKWSIVGNLEHGSSVGEVSCLEVSISHFNP